jgi:ATP/maltotriose-dependent transcriptional regulator MalT/DNA-binding SARP family transcriptional activator
MARMPSRPVTAVDTRRVDTRADASLSFAPLDRLVEREQPAPSDPAPHSHDRATDARSRRRRPRIVVEACRSANVAGSLANPGGHLGMAEYPVQLSKVQPPPLREETLARDRLLEWLAVKVHRRAVLLIAEAGYGKTTLLADFSRRTRLRIMWYRLDRGDRDWVGFLAHLVAAVRIHVADFGASTSALLRETATASPPLDTVLETFLRELAGLPNEPAALVFDDFHLVDDAPDIRTILRELLTRGPERMSFVFASRQEPPIRLARLRALGEVAELRTDDLRFDAGETERLFRETYDMRLEPGVLTELSRRTEGWAASLQLVRSVIHDRDPGQVRAFISSLSGAEGHLYEYLAEEVIGDLPKDLQTFLMRTSVLEVVDLTLGPVAAEASIDEARAFIEEGERHGLFGKGGPNTHHVARAHPLVRDFLQARLLRSIHEEGILDLNLRVAQAAESVDWRLAGRHYLAAGKEADARRVLASAIEQILATGAFAAAEDLSSSLASGALGGAPGLILRSRLAHRRAAAEESLALAEQARLEEPQSTAVLLNLMGARMLAGDLDGAVDASRVLEKAAPSELAVLARVFNRTVETSVAGSLDNAATEYRRLAVSLRDRGQSHFLGVALCNEAHIRMAMGDADRAKEYADEAIALLSASSAGIELVSARLVRSVALAHLGDIVEARKEIDVAIQTASPGQHLEVATEAAAAEEFYGEPSRAIDHLTSVRAQILDHAESRDWALLTRAVVRAELGDSANASTDLRAITAGLPRSTIAFELRRLLAECLIQVLGGESGGRQSADVAISLANAQGARMWADYGAVLGATAARSEPSSVLIEIGARNPVALSMAAEAVIRRIGDCSDEALSCIRDEAGKRPWRWVGAVRRATLEGGPNQLPVARLLEAIGDKEDIVVLRAIARKIRHVQGSGLGRSLARRLAPKVIIEDLGRIRVVVGGRTVEGIDIRRKVLGLLCLLLTRTRWTATREEVVDALWPDLDPQSALNSLNQTVYFLRRVFEPDYGEETSPGYVQQDGETIWLDAELIDARSRRCLEIIRQSPAEPDPDAAVVLAQEYRGKFALDFAYEEWAGPFRDGLHAAYLRVMESSVRLDVDAGAYSRGLLLAERANEIEPDNEELQVALIRIYRLAGAHAAAAERYAHYAKGMRDLGIEPAALLEL